MYSIGDIVISKHIFTSADLFETPAGTKFKIISRGRKANFYNLEDMAGRSYPNCYSLYFVWGTKKRGLFYEI